MRRPVTLEEFAKLVDLDTEEIERYTKAGLLEVDGDGHYDEFDILRLRFILISLDRGETLEQIAGRCLSGTPSTRFSDLLWPRGVSYTPEEAAEKVGLTVEQLQTFRTAIGLPGTLLGDEDIATFHGVRRMIEAGFPLEAMLEGARVLGDAMRRFADTEIRLTHTYLHEPLLASGMPEREVARQTQDVIESAVLPVIDPIILEIHRQHTLRAVLEDELMHLEAAERAGVPGTIEAAILFVDLTSFTSLAHVMGDEAAATVLDRFDSLVRPMVLDHRGSLVKQIGDAFMLAFTDATDAAVFAVALADAAAREEQFPAVRAGIHAGPVLFRVGDYVGNTVNIASRVATSAMAGEIVMTEPVAQAAQKAEIPVEEVGVRLLRGVSDPLTLYRVVRARAVPKARDPVCGMLVGEEAFGQLTWDGIEFSFCSEDCLRKFLEDPEKYARNRA